MSKPLVIIDIPNGKAMSQIARHCGYPAENIEQFKQLEPEHFPTYIYAKIPKDNCWGSNLAWAPEYRYKHVRYEEYIKEHKLKPRRYTKREIQKWVKEQLAAVKETFTQHFPEESFHKYVKELI